MFKVASIFSDHMVLQRDKAVAIFGSGENEKKVYVEILDKQYDTVVKDGKWLIHLPPMKAQIDLSMTISSDNQVYTYDNIAIGEVFLAGGQSNMEMELKDCTDGLRMLKEDKDVHVRYYNTLKSGKLDDDFYRQEEKTSWCEFSEENSRNWSGVAYVYAKRLARELGVTVGIIGCYLGGTSASCWISKEALIEDKDLSWYVDNYEKAIEGKSNEEQKKEYEEFLIYHSNWEKAYGKLLEEKPGTTWAEAAVVCGPSKWPGPLGLTNPYRPNGLYETMIKRIAPYTLKGVIYYQGESDDHKGKIYDKLLSRLIKQWRDDFKDIELPFLFVQLPMYIGQGEIDRKHWCILRENQMNTFLSIKNTGIAVCLDCGEYGDIHPKDKRPVGERLALQALYHIYGRVKEKDAFGPMLLSFYRKDNKCYLEFQYAKDGFDTKGEPIIELSENGIDFSLANVEFMDNTIVVWSDDIQKPCEIRYAWTNYGPVTIYGKNTIPMAPFRIIL